MADIRRQFVLLAALALVGCQQVQPPSQVIQSSGDGNTNVNSQDRPMTPAERDKEMLACIDEEFGDTHDRYHDSFCKGVAEGFALAFLGEHPEIRKRLVRANDLYGGRGEAR